MFWLTDEGKNHISSLYIIIIVAKTIPFSFTTRKICKYKNDAYIDLSTMQFESSNLIYKDSPSLSHETEIVNVGAI